MVVMMTSTSYAAESSDRIDVMPTTCPVVSTTADTAAPLQQQPQLPQINDEYDSIVNSSNDGVMMANSDYVEDEDYDEDVTSGCGNVDGDDEDDDDGNGSEADLTNLGWLSDLKNMTNWPDIVAAVGGNRNCLLDVDEDDNDGLNEDEIIRPISDKNLSQERFKKFMIQVKQ